MIIPKALESWEDTKKGIGKKTIKFDSNRLVTPSEVSSVTVVFSNIQHLEDRTCQYLENVDKRFPIRMGSAVTPIDCYIEMLLLHVKKGENCSCFIKTSTTEITFNMEVFEIEDDKSLFALKLQDIFALAKRYKANGVEMYKLYPKFAEEYFCKAAKILISFQPFDLLTKDEDGVDGSKVNELLQNIYSNIAACRIKENKFDDVLFLTHSVEDSLNEAPEKAVYRRALAFCNLQMYEEGKHLLDQYGKTENQEMIKLYKRIHSEWKVSEEKYASLVRKMFK